MTFTVEVLTMVALWCGHPSIELLSESQVNSCRQEMIKCLEASGNGTSKKIAECAKKVKI